MEQVKLTNPGQSFGHPTLAAQLGKRLRRHYSKASAFGESSLVIGIFGEWGSGKSNLLHLVREEMRPDGDSQDVPVITVAFNPWRYEKEAHLIVPLLKTTQVEIANWLLSHEEKGIGDSLKTLLKQGGAFLGATVVAFVSAFKTKFGVPGTGVEIELEGKTFLDEFEAMLDAKQKEPFADLSSVYYEFQQHLQAFTSPEAKQGFRLLFLIDDLDRCLPEKAVEMLESIKLFLDVEGCAFVLALDDEVVERGIIHRYRDYLFQQGSGEGKGGNSLAHLPITGQEYLEKIVQLPFRLPQPTRDNIRLFLQQREPELFGRADEPERGENLLLDLFAECIPPVPRKLIRAVELLKLLLDILDSRKSRHEFQLLPLAKLTLLQLFAPDLYRFGRRYDAGFMTRLERWVTFDHWGMDDFVGRTECVMLGLEYQHLNNVEKRDACFAELEKPKQNDLRLFRKNDMRLYQHFAQAAHNRSGFDPERLVRTGSIADVRLTAYFSFLEDAIPERKPALPEETGMPVDTNDIPVSKGIRYEKVEQSVFAKDPRPLARIRKLDEFLERLFSTDKANWKSALQGDEMDGRVLDDKTFGAVCERLADESYAGFATQADWLAALDKVLSDIQFDALVKQTNDFKAVFPTVDLENVDALSEIGLWVVFLTETRKQRLEPYLNPVRQWALDIVENGKLELKQRARVGDILGQIGDPRFHGTDLFCLPKQFQGQAEAFYGFIKIPAGTFIMGDGSGGDNKPHEVTLTRDYAIARYPVTVAQYACYLIHAKAELPNEWQEQQQYPNRPVIYVNWHEASAYCEWLKEQLWEKGITKAGQIVRLPTEAEWERAARNGDQRTYPWGDQWDANKANAEGMIGQPSAVGMYPKQHPENIQDMAGNVWEWCRDGYGDYPAEPVRNPEGSQQAGVERVVRGGSWSFNGRDVRSAFRYRYSPGLRYSIIGFRLALGH